ncbi:uncharacterized protein LOC130820720 isoform X2 [Amaranthus tricolor]|uniref:uncharacterized protein LOC130820720 isoform X2 n=1 Tax=Amaranthus tricolor TaxID=29722 RepID=UPI00258E0223|nr:uncharacterized protein LOC130820720 isoform X2 [Amaranthus tricolor]
MSGNLRPDLTVNVGRSGQVVKRAGGLSEEGFRDGLTEGNKRSVKDRLGGNFDDRNHFYSKRQRGDGFIKGSKNDMHLHAGDLRFKLMQKSMTRQSQNNDSHDTIDLRDKLLSRNSGSSFDGKAMRLPESIVSSWHPLVQTRDAGITRHPVLESSDISIIGRYPFSGNPSDLSLMDSSGRSRTYSSWTLDNLRRRSPDRLHHSSASWAISSERRRENLQRRAISPERRREDLQRRAISYERRREDLQRRAISLERREDLQRRAIREYNDEKPPSCMRSSPTRPISSSPFLTKCSLPPAPVKYAVPLPSHYSQSNGIVRKIPSMGDGYPTVESWLRALGLEGYAITFKAEGIDMHALKRMGDSDLKRARERRLSNL